MFNLKEKIQQYRRNTEKEKEELTVEELLKSYKKKYDKGEVGVSEDLPYELFEEEVQKKDYYGYRHIDDLGEFKKYKNKHIA